MSSEELNISSALNSTPKKRARKRKTDSRSPVSSEDEGEIPPMPPKIFGNLGTPMPSGATSTVAVADAEEWEEWKRQELAKRKWRKHLRSKWDLRKGELPEKSDSIYLSDRHVHHKNTKKAYEQVCDGLVAINERNMNVGKGKAINIQVNGMPVSKKSSKKFAADVEKACSKKGKPSMSEMMESDLDEDEARAEAEWAARFAKKSRKSRRRHDMIKDMEVGQVFDPYEEFVEELEDDDRMEDNDEKHYKKWLQAKIEENKVSPNYNAYQLEMLDLDKDGLKNKRTLKSVVRGVANFYRNLRRKS
uniref:Uncharacterized protein n=1 Tax=Caenorhabditis japonica TaxID=281687 RepID=A0A8R1HIF9_CAEJA